MDINNGNGGTMNIKNEIRKVVIRDAAGQFAPVDLSLEGVNKWRVSVGLPPLAVLPMQW